MQTTHPPIFASDVAALFTSPTTKVNFCVFLNAGGMHLTVAGAEEVARLAAEYFHAQRSSFVEPKWDFALKPTRYVRSDAPTDAPTETPNPASAPTNTNSNTDPAQEKEQPQPPATEEEPKPLRNAHDIASGDMIEFVRLLNGLQIFLCGKGYKVDLLDVTKFASELRRFLEVCGKDHPEGEGERMAEGKVAGEAGVRVEESAKGKGKEVRRGNDQGAAGGGGMEGTWASRHLPKGGFAYC